MCYNGYTAGSNSDERRKANMEEKKTTYLEQKTDDQTSVDVTEAADLFSRLSPDAQDAIIDLIKCLLSEK